MRKCRSSAVVTRGTRVSSAVVVGGWRRCLRGIVGWHRRRAVGWRWWHGYVAARRHRRGGVCWESQCRHGCCTSVVVVGVDGWRRHGVARQYGRGITRWLVVRWLIVVSYAVGRCNGMLHRVVFSYVPKRIVAVGRCGGMLYCSSCHFSVGIALCFIHHCDGTRP